MGKWRAGDPDASDENSSEGFSLGGEMNVFERSCAN